MSGGHVNTHTHTSRYAHMRAGTGVHTHIQTHVRIDAQVILAISVDSGAYMYIL